MTEQARSITADQLRTRMPVHNRNDELGHLAVVFNELLGRIEEAFDRLKRFTADASHELRTPLTAIWSVGEVGLREPRMAPLPGSHREHARGGHSAYAARRQPAVPLSRR